VTLTVTPLAAPLTFGTVAVAVATAAMTARALIAGATRVAVPLTVPLGSFARGGRLCRGRGGG
jgi:hypothetical protein